MKLLPLAFVFLYYFRDDISFKYEQVKEVNSLVRTKYKSPLKVYWVTFSMISQMYYQKLLQRFSNVEIKDKKTLVISYTFQEHPYKIVLDLRGGPSSVEKILNRGGEDITDKIRPFLGPSCDFHNRAFSPDFWDETYLEFHMLNGDVKSFDVKENIILA